MSIESPEVKPTACDTCRRLNIQCNLDNYIDDCERCTSLGERCFITDDYNVTIYKVPQRALHKFHSAKFICDIVALSHELHDRQSNGENTYVILDKIASEFVVIPEEAIQYEEVRGFLCYHFGNVMRWFQMNPEHQVWTVARYDQKTKQSLVRFGAMLKSLDFPRYSAAAACFMWQIGILEAEGQSPSRPLSDNHNQTHTASSDSANEPELLFLADIQVGESHSEKPYAGKS